MKSTRKMMYAILFFSILQKKQAVLYVLDYFKENPHRDHTSKMYSDIKKFIENKYHVTVKVREMFINNIYGIKKYVKSFLTDFLV